MKEIHVSYLACPKCKSELELGEIVLRQRDLIEEGTLTCRSCRRDFEIVKFIPRFVSKDNYAYGFGLEWTIHDRTQYDSHTGLPISETRFFEETRWPRNLKGEIILEAGCGSGRFTEQALKTGAFIITMDYSHAVEVNYRNNGPRDNLLCIQADIYEMPFCEKQFNKIFCFGVIQHTPDPKKAFLSLPSFIKDGGELVADFYKKQFRKLFAIKYYIRPLTKRIKPEWLYCMTKAYIDLMWPLSNLFRKLPRIGPMMNWALGIADHSRLGLKGKMLKKWAYLDTFDMFAPHYDYPQTKRTIEQWFKEGGFVDVEVTNGYNGLEGRGKLWR